ncbi:MAG: LysR family transcriptional regulator [Alphaproteobacteria bacterium]|nr:LysR family transcriptional regulator [Alphaproteobacteria bacterium]
MPKPHKRKTQCATCNCEPFTTWRSRAFNRRRAGLTQPAVSDQVRKLEEEYQIILFHRNKRQVS